MVKFVVWPAGC